jgi:hypothetical protein
MPLDDKEIVDEIVLRLPPAIAEDQAEPENRDSTRS